MMFDRVSLWRVAGSSWVHELQVFRGFALPQACFGGSFLSRNEPCIEIRRIPPTCRLWQVQVRQEAIPRFLNTIVMVGLHSAWTGQVEKPELPELLQILQLKPKP